VITQHLDGSLTLAPIRFNTMSVIVVCITNIGTLKIHDVLGEHLGILCLGKIEKTTKLAPLRVIVIPAGELPLLSANLSSTDLALNRSLRDDTSNSIHAGLSFTPCFSENGDCHCLFRREGLRFENGNQKGKSKNEFFHFRRIQVVSGCG